MVEELKKKGPNPIKTMWTVWSEENPWRLRSCVLKTMTPLRHWEDSYGVFSKTKWWTHFSYQRLTQPEVGLSKPWLGIPRCWSMLILWLQPCRFNRRGSCPISLSVIRVDVSGQLSNPVSSGPLSNSWSFSRWRWKTWLRLASTALEHTRWKTMPR